MTTAPSTTQEAGRAAVTRAARTVREAHRTFPAAIDFAHDVGLDNAEIWELCRTAGLDDATVRELIDGEGL